MAKRAINANRKRVEIRLDMTDDFDKKLFKFLNKGSTRSAVLREALIAYYNGTEDGIRPEMYKKMYEAEHDKYLSLVNLIASDKNIAQETLNKLDDEPKVNKDDDVKVKPTDSLDDAFEDSSQNKGKNKVKKDDVAPKLGFPANAKVEDSKNDDDGDVFASLFGNINEF